MTIYLAGRTDNGFAFAGDGLIANIKKDATALASDITMYRKIAPVSQHRDYQFGTKSNLDLLVMSVAGILDVSDNVFAHLVNFENNFSASSPNIRQDLAVAVQKAYREIELGIHSPVSDNMRTYIQRTKEAEKKLYDGRDDGMALNYLFSTQGGNFIVTKVFSHLTLNGADHHIRQQKNPAFHFFSGGSGYDVVCPQLVDLFCSTQGRFLKTEDLNDVFMYLISVSEHFHSRVVGGEYSFSAIERGQLKPTSTFHPMYDGVVSDNERLSLARETLEREDHQIGARMFGLHEEQRYDTNKIKQAVARGMHKFCSLMQEGAFTITPDGNTLIEIADNLNGIDVLRLVSERRVSRAQSTSSATSRKKIYESAFHFLDAYLHFCNQPPFLDLTPSGFQQDPPILEPVYDSPKYLEYVVSRLKSNHPTAHHRAFLGRAMVRLGQVRGDLGLMQDSLRYLDGQVGFEEEGKSWEAVAYMYMGDTSRAKNLFGEVLNLDDFVISSLRKPVHIALIRSLKGLINLGDSYRKSKLMNYAAALMNQGLLTKSQIQAI